MVTVARAARKEIHAETVVAEERFNRCMAQLNILKEYLDNSRDVLQWMDCELAAVEAVANKGISTRTIISQCRRVRAEQDVILETTI
jgi:hypothetical protein